MSAFGIHVSPRLLRQSRKGATTWPVSPWGKNAATALASGMPEDRLHADKGFSEMSKKAQAWLRLRGATKRARTQNQNDTDAETRLWSDLKNRRQNGYKFARQVQLGPYMAEFICREEKLIIELSDSKDAESKTDIARIEWLNTDGYAVLRFSNGAILRERRAVLDAILAVLDGGIVEKSDIVRFYPAVEVRE